MRLYMAVVIGAAALAIGAVLWATSAVDSRTKDAASTANAAAAASQIQAGLNEPLLPLLFNAASFVLSPDGLASLSETQRTSVLAVISFGFTGAQPPTSALPDVSIPVRDGEAITLHRSLELYAAQVEELASGVKGFDLTGVVAEKDRLQAAADTYFHTDDSAANFVALFSGILALSEELDAAQDQFTLGVARTQDNLNQATSQARLVMLVALVSLTALMALATFLIGRLISGAFRSSETERETLRETSQALRLRNDQLNALYEVFSQITDKLSTRHVINATLHETLRVLVDAKMVVLRLLEGDELVMVGNLSSDGQEVDDMPRLSIGEASPGRAVLRGRTIRTGSLPPEAIDAKYAQAGIQARVESGVVSPLIFGARVIGTLGVWSTEAGAFSDEDVQILEMMASQVASAVAAADNAENSERKALLDPLTGVPNRRQLTEDIANHRGLLDSGGNTAVAMVDIDNFKKVNDELGHRVGDVVLQEVASVLRSAVRDGDEIYRYGGEEFVAIFKGASRKDALAAAERLRRAVEAESANGNQLAVAQPLTISIGVALMPDHGTDITQLIEKADRAMYRAKDLGRNRVQVWEEES